MAACDEREWDIRLKVDGDSEDEGVLFTNIQITGGVVIGEVRDSQGRLMSALRGLCRPAMSTGQPDMSHLEFIFYVTDARARVVLLRLEGVGYVPPFGGAIEKEFRGEFRAYQRYSGDFFSVDPATLTGPTGGQLSILHFDEGDTGTGTGTGT